MSQLFVGQLSLSVIYLLLIVVAVFAVFCITLKSLPLRMAIMALCIAFGILLYLSIPLIMGWATNLPIPDTPTQLIAVERGKKQPTAKAEEEKKQKEGQAEEQGEGQEPEGKKGQVVKGEAKKGGQFKGGEGDEKIFIWLKEDGVPRVHEVPFDPELYKELKKAEKLARSGKKWVFIKRSDPKKMPKGTQESAGQFYDRDPDEMPLDIILRDPGIDVTKD